jgi:hypothetical protein
LTGGLAPGWGRLATLADAALLGGPLGVEDEDYAAA